MFKLKSKLIIVVILMFGITVFMSCEKEKALTNNETDFIENENIVDVDVSKAGSQTISYYCGGSCNGGGGCSMIFDPSGGYIECGCEGCHLVIDCDKSISSELKNKLLEQMSKRDLFQKRLDKFVKEEYTVDEYYITKVEYSTFGKDYYLLYDFRTASGKKESVMFVSLYKNDKGGYETIIVDCRGTCSGGCRERYIFNPPSVECTCEGDDCIMHIND